MDKYIIKFKQSRLSPANKKSIIKKSKPSKYYKYLSEKIKFN